MESAEERLRLYCAYGGSTCRSLDHLLIRQNTMALASQSKLIPGDPNDISSNAIWEYLDADEFASFIPVVLSSTTARSSSSIATANQKLLFGAKFSALVQRHATEPAVVSAISSILTRPLDSEDTSQLICTVLFAVIYQLPEDDILQYRGALTVLSKANTDASSDPRYIGLLAQQARDILRFVETRDVAWAPEHRGDFMAERSLQERVDTARAMRPYVDDLLRWLRDRNWPPYTRCEAQLARFPEIAVMPIRRILIEHRGEGEWTNNLLQFVQNRVPVGRSWEAMYPQVKALLDKSKGDEANHGTPEYATNWIETLNRWRSSQEGLRCA